MSEQIRSLLDELRALVHGIMPATLQERGLPAGIAALRRSDADAGACRRRRALARMDAEVESTGYFVVAEAFANAVKHAAAQQISIDLAVQDGRLEIIVTDDGTGLAGSTRVRSAQPAGPGRGAGRYGDPPAGARPRNDVASGVRMRVIIAEDEVLLREGISRILGDEDYDVVALAGDQDDLLGKVRAFQPDLVVTDIRMPPTSPTRASSRRCRSGGSSRPSRSWCCPSTSTLPARWSC